MKHILSTLCSVSALICATFFLAACHKNDDDARNKPGHPGERMERTLIIYMASENGLSYFVDSDSLEIAAGLPSVPDGARVVVFIDDTRSSRICVGTNDTPLQMVRKFPNNINSTDSASMLAVLRDIFTTYPANHYGITFWSHASGWVEHSGASRVRRRSFGIDNGRRDPYSNDGSEMNITTMANILRQLPHTDYILFDACFMQCVEVAYELRDVTDWVIGSPAEIPGNGAPYQSILSSLCQSQADINGAMRQYYDFYNSGAGYKIYHGVLLSAIRTDRLAALAAATRPLVASVFAGRSEANATDVQRYCPQRNDLDYYTEYYDISHLFYKNVSEPEYLEWRIALDNAVPYIYASEEWYSALMPYSNFISVTDSEHCAFVSMFAPSTIYDDYRKWNTAYHSLSWYRAAGFDQTGW